MCAMPLGWSLRAAPALAQDAAKAQGIAAQVCAACHAADGNSIGPANPKIAGQIPEYLHKQLVDFKAQGGKKPVRENAVMTGMVANLSEADLKNLAAYYAGQKLKPAAAADKELAALGQKVWRGGNAPTGVPACAGCHGPTGAGMPAQYPRIAGQYAEYLAAQLKRVQGWRPRQRSQRHDARRCCAHERARDPGRGGVRRWAEIVNL